MSEELEQELSIINAEYRRTMQRIMSALTPLPQFSDRYIIYSETQDILVVVGFDPYKNDGANTLVMISPEDYETYPLWRIPPLVVGALKGYIQNFMKDLKRRANLG